MAENLLVLAILLFSLALTAQAVFTLMLMLYTWALPDRLRQASSPEAYAPPQLSFTAILPARHEQDVIAQTIQRVWETRYPHELIEVVVVCEAGDRATIAEAQRAIDAIGHPNLRVVTFDGQPINKPRGLNVAFHETRNDVVTIFDAEDDVHPEMFWIVNTIMSNEDAGIVQAGVQLMDFRSRWFSVHNVLEYFFWFKSRLHFHARIGMVPLGGNTVFVRRPLLQAVGGWDEHCLTEDADIGLRLSALNNRIAVTYDARHTTREETPPTLGSFVRQRTRWNQGFLQILRKGTWHDLPTPGQRLLAIYTLAFPFIQAVVGVLWLPALLAMFFLEMPVVVAMLSLLPLYALGFQYITNVVGLFEFASTYGMRVTLRDLAILTAGFLPYQVLLSAGAVRAVYRELRGLKNWEKTAHTGAHRGARDPLPARTNRTRPALRGD
ncbi:MAG TPA: glycosyltransferase [Thermomicrobiales bacterium]|nr:glycosyltransferase [Thermomicrobiales bacterium]